jgi:hypothetical protein
MSSTSRPTSATSIEGPAVRRRALPHFAIAERLQIGVASARRELEQHGYVSEWFLDQLFLELDALIAAMPLDSPLPSERAKTLRRGPSQFGPVERTR